MGGELGDVVWLEAASQPFTRAEWSPTIVSQVGIVPLKPLSKGHRVKFWIETWNDLFESWEQTILGELESRDVPAVCVQEAVEGAFIDDPSLDPIRIIFKLLRYGFYRQAVVK